MALYAVVCPWQIPEWATELAGKNRGILQRWSPSIHNLGRSLETHKTSKTLIPERFSGIGGCDCTPALPCSLMKVDLCFKPNGANWCLNNCSKASRPEQMTLGPESPTWRYIPEKTTTRTDQNLETEISHIKRRKRHKLHKTIFSTHRLDSSHYHL